jgi:hypothetical protein
LVQPEVEIRATYSPAKHHRDGRCVRFETPLQGTGAAAVPHDASTGRFAAGNPGRAPGSRNRASLARDMIESESEMLVAQVLAHALSGDPISQRAARKAGAWK